MSRCHCFFSSEMVLYHRKVIFVWTFKELFPFCLKSNMCAFFAWKTHGRHSTRTPLRHFKIKECFYIKERIKMEFN